VVVTATDGTTSTVNAVTTNINNSSIRPAYIYDSRDNPFEPVRGQRLSIAASTPAASLGRQYFIRPRSATASSPDPRTAVAPDLRLQRRGRLDQHLPASPASSLERFYLGGENSIRGFRFRSLFARNPDAPP